MRRPRVPVPDEAASALDNASEKIALAEIGAMRRERGSMAISIAHRPSTLRGCNGSTVDHGRMPGRAI